MDRTLIIPEPQILLHFPNDPGGFYHHHRILLHKIGGGQWVLLTPDLELAVEDLSVRRHRVLGRHAPFPADIIDECYVFDDLTKAELERQKRLAKTMGSILDDSQVVSVENLTWIVADPSSKRFGDVVPAELVGDIVCLGQAGLVSWEDETEYVKEMAASDVQSFKESKQGALGDARLLADHRDAQGRRFMALNEALALMSEESSKVRGRAESTSWPSGKDLET